MVKLDDSSARRFPEMPVCFRCAHWHEGKDTCGAFPNGIPDEIWLHGDDHRQPFKGDRGVRFEPRTKEKD